jgi:hypothetical protein
VINENFKAKATEVFDAKKEVINEKFKAKATEVFDAQANSKAGTEEGSDGITFDQALQFDEGMLNSWFEETKLSIRDRAILLQRMRQFKETFAHQSTEAIESELTTKMLFDALLFAVAFTVPTGVDRAEMQEAWIVDDAIYNVSKTHLGTYEVILLVMTFLVTTSTGLALIVGFTIYSCLRYERPSSIEEADLFYTRFQAAFRLSYGFTYLAILLAPFSCLELHFIKSSSEPTRLFFNMYGFILYGGLVVFLIWSLRQARRSRAELLEMRDTSRKEFLHDKEQRDKKDKEQKDKGDEERVKLQKDKKSPSMRRGYSCSRQSSVRTTETTSPKNSPPNTPEKQTRGNSTDNLDA